MSWNETNFSKFLALVLRHKPETIGIQLDKTGWVRVDTLIAACQRHDCPLTPETLDRIVENNSKKRFHFNEDKTKIRAAQGHSAAVDLDYEPRKPPDTLFHGTAARFIASIKKTGLLKQSRHHVHMSTEIATAKSVGQRYGKPIVLLIDAAKMHTDGHVFYVSENNVWLTEHVPPSFIDFTS